MDSQSAWIRDLDVLRASRPRPDFVRERYVDLCGTWEFEFDPTNFVDGDSRVIGRPLKDRIEVPFAPQSIASGIADSGFYPCMWYRRTFDVDETWLNGRVFLNFGALDSECTVWVNGLIVGTHTGGYDSFRFEITDAVCATENVVLVRAVDDLSLSRPRGKQAWASSSAVWYTPMSGIWQPVWLEATGKRLIDDLVILEAHPETGRFDCNVRIDGPQSDAHVVVSLRGGDGDEITVSARCRYPSTLIRMNVPAVVPWEPGVPRLYDLEVQLFRGTEVLDRVVSYVGFRSIAVSETSLVINGKPTFLRMVLDQGLWPETLYTPPSGQAARKDIELSMQMGFNGCRKHIKPEDPRFLYWADRLGYLVWAEFPSFYADTDSSRRACLQELPRQIARDRNHPSVIAWVAFNESWGIRGVDRDPGVQSWVRAVRDLVALIDPSRPVVDNDGWEHTATDILTYHSYASDGPELQRHHTAFLEGEAPAGHALMAGGCPPPRLPVVASEIGGIGFTVSDHAEKAWGYGAIPRRPEELEGRIESLLSSIHKIDELAGFCYTQLTDVEQEINGLLTARREPKLPIETIRRIITGAE